MSVGAVSSQQGRAEEGICGGVVGLSLRGAAAPKPRRAWRGRPAALCPLPAARSPLPGAAPPSAAAEPSRAAGAEGPWADAGAAADWAPSRSRHGRNDAHGHGSAQPVAPRRPAGERDLAASRRPTGTAGFQRVSVASGSSPLPGCPAQPRTPPPSASPDHCARVGCLRLLVCGQALGCQQAPGMWLLPLHRAGLG